MTNQKAAAPLLLPFLCVRLSYAIQSPFLTSYANAPLDDDY